MYVSVITLGYELKVVTVSTQGSEKDIILSFRVLLFF